MRGFHPPAKSLAATRGFSPAAAAALAQAQNQAPDSIPAMVKPGEFVLPPDTVQAIGGPHALQGVVNATHTPVRGFVPRARPEEPRQFFANGGLVQDEPKRANSFGDAAAAAQDAGVTRVGGLANGGASANRIVQVPAAIGTQPNRAPDPAAPPPAARGFAPNVQPAQPTTSSAVRGSTSALPAAAPPSEPTAAPLSGNVTRVGSSYSGGNVGGEITVNGNTPGGGSMVADGQRTRGFSPALGGAAAASNNWKDTIAKVEAMGFKQLPSQPLGEPGAATVAAEGGAGAGRGFVNPVPAKPGTPQAQQAAADAGKQAIPGVFQHGRGQYSDNATGMGFAPAFTGQPSAQNLAAADALAGRNVAPPAVTTPVGFQPAGISAPTMRHSGNDWQARNDLRNAQVSASSITQSDKWGKGRDRTATENYAALLRADSAARGAQPGIDQEAMRQNGGLQREAMQQTGETSRTQLQQALADIRERRTAGQQATQNDLARQRLALDAARASRDGVPSGYRPKANGTGLEYIPGGPADPATQAGKKPLNDTQAKALQFGSRMQQAGQNLDALASNGATQPGYIKRAADVVGAGALANWTQNPQQQQVEQSQRDFVNAVLRRESGAAISNSEFDNARQQYFPQPGDDAKVIEQKRRNRELATRGVLAEVPDSEKRVQQVTAADQPPQQPQRAVSRTGTINGRKVVQYSDGSIHYAD
ncbi:hypothetical protein [Acidovorax kalamii]|uniref:hypothetical protein n=1 Tax=Acidovorax kalamii TaxID=2004485 RepID=UPI002091B8CB|nr:hypothetical protein [Acidovorax kalamii]MCO5358422.1 hypothetical protein [Acidovorax kalamii]